MFTVSECAEVKNLLTVTSPLCDNKCFSKELAHSLSDMRAGDSKSFVESSTHCQGVATLKHLISPTCHRF